MGEAIAIGILEEQALCYPTDPFVMTVPTFDGEVIRIGERSATADGVGVRSVAVRPVGGRAPG